MGDLVSLIERCARNTAEEREIQIPADIGPNTPLFGRNGIFAAIFAARRLVYFFVRAAQWHPSRLPRLILFQPVLWIGLAAWAVGFRKGSQAAREHR